MVGIESFGLLCGHLLGDYILQNDWMAKNKANGRAIPLPQTRQKLVALVALLERNYRRGHLACTIHCLLYTLAIWACSFWWLPWWGLPVVFAVHWPIDRFRLARLWMEEFAGQHAFANGPLAPWSIVAVDNTFHLLTLFLIAALA